MLNLNIKQTLKRVSAESINKQIDFGTAVGITRTLKQAQPAVQAEVSKDFTYRNKWLPQSNKFGIRITPATPQTLSGSIHTDAGWLAKQKIGGSVSAGQRRRTFPYTFEGREYIAVPSKELRPKGSTKVLGKRLWPSNLKNAFVIRAKDGTLLLAVRFGPGLKNVAIMYVLVEKVEVKRKDAFTPPIEKVVHENLTNNIMTEIEKAIKTAK